MLKITPLITAYKVGHREDDRDEDMNNTTRKTLTFNPLPMNYTDNEHNQQDSLKITTTQQKFTSSLFQKK
jgi:hypothetical protein